MIEFTARGMYCRQGDFYIDASKPVPYNIVTHAHADHARAGHKHYLAHHNSIAVMKLRLGSNISIEGLGYGQTVRRQGVAISLHPAGHILGSAQVRLEYKGAVWVVSGDYKPEADPLAPQFEPVPCQTFITECTFAMPVYSWPDPTSVLNDINGWWKKNQSEGKVSLLCGYALGKAQRLLCGLDTSIGQIFCHGAVWTVNAVLRESGTALPEAVKLEHSTHRDALPGSLVLAPPSAMNSRWASKIKNKETGLASGWMQLRGARRRRAVDRGFILSDHADWKGLNDAVRATGAETVVTTHGYTATFTRWLQDQGYHAADISMLMPQPPVEQDPAA
jgi:putative mRNA 3-end processing factor